MEDFGWEPLAFMGGGLLLTLPFVINVYLALRIKMRLRRWARTEARVLWTETRTNEDNLKEYTATFSYSAGGTAHTGRAEVADEEPAGTMIPLVYDPEEPSRHQLIVNWGCGRVGAIIVSGMLFVPAVGLIVKGVMELIAAL